GCGYGPGGLGALRAPRASLVPIRRLVLRLEVWRVPDRRQQVGDVPGRLLGRRRRGRDSGRGSWRGGSWRGGSWRGGRGNRGDGHGLAGILGLGKRSAVAGGGRGGHVERVSRVEGWDIHPSELQMRRID